MDFINNIDDETIIICNANCKDYFISNNNLCNIKVMTLEEFLKKFLFDYSEDTIIYVMNKMNVKYEVALVYIKNLYYVENKEYPVKKLNVLKELKQELDNNNLLVYNDLFKNYVSNISVIFYDMELEEYYLRLFSNLNFKIINPKLSEYSHSVFEFTTIEEEIEFVAFKISELISNGILIQNIKLTNVESNYYNGIERIFSLYNLKVNIPYQSSLDGYQYVQDFINNYKSNSLEEAVLKLDNKHVLYEKLINVINKYYIYNNKELLVEKLSQEFVCATKYTNSIEIIDYLTTPISDNDYVFMMSFNDKVIPKSIKDIDYITDNIKKYVYLDGAHKKNGMLRVRILQKIKNIKNLIITYKLRDSKNSYYPSTLCNNFEIVKNVQDYQVSYSEKYNKIKLALCIDNYIKYGFLDQEYKKLADNFQVKYNSYDNTYKQINRSFDKLTLSYSKMNIYNKCAFRYYLSEILKLDIFEENFSTIIGSMVHYVMEKCLSNEEYDVKKYAFEFLNDKTFTAKENFFLEKYVEGVQKLLDQVMLEKQQMSFKKAMYEKVIEIEYEDNVKFKGIIDKILYNDENGSTIMSLIDYKTGRDDISLKYLKYGINIQLPIYLYLSSHLNLSNITYSGFYLQKLNITQDDYRLEGYSNSEPDILSFVDCDYDSSKIIKGMKLNKDGSFGRNAKVLSNDEIKKVIDLTDKIIKETIEGIKSNQFQINPKKDFDKVIGCEHCKFKDICFVKNKDYKTISALELEEVE